MGGVGNLSPIWRRTCTWGKNNSQEIPSVLQTETLYHNILLQVNGFPVEHHPPTEDPISTDEMSNTDADWAVNISLENLKTKINDTC